MKLTRILTSLALVVAASVGLGENVGAAYPPGGVGTLGYSTIQCTRVWVSDTTTELESWSGRIDYVVTAESATLTVGTSSEGSPLIQQTVPMGPGSLTIGSETPGLKNLGNSVFFIKLDDGTSQTSLRAVFCSTPLDIQNPSVRPPAAAGTTGGTTDVKPVTGGSTNLLIGLAVMLALGGLAMTVVSRRRPATQ